MAWLIVFIVVLFLFALLVDWRRKRNNNNSQRSINPGTKPGEGSNHMMGDNKYDSGGPQ